MGKLNDLDEMFNSLPIDVRLAMTEAARVRACRSVMVLEDAILHANAEDPTVLTDMAQKIRLQRLRLEDILADERPPWDVP